MKRDIELLQECFTNPEFSELILPKVVEEQLESIEKIRLCATSSFVAQVALF
jgi:hypothetical protein